MAGNSSDWYFRSEIWMRELSKSAQAGVPVPLEAGLYRQRRWDSFVTFAIHNLLLEEGVA